VEDQLVKHIAVYIRVSSRQQDQRSQEPDLKRWAEAQELPVVWFRDKFTGRQMARPGWDKLQAAMDAAKVSTIVCWRLDRLGRTAAGLTKLFVELRQRSINLVSLREGIDLATPAGRMLANMLASVAEFETELRAERVLAGQAAARAAGKTWGGSQKGRRLKVKAEQVEVVRRMHKEGSTVAAMARAVSLSRPTVYSIIDAL
jgi:DNA invertase Pin-like site-specific DNA recombinase